MKVEYEFTYSYYFFEDPLQRMDYILEAIGLQKQKRIIKYGDYVESQVHEWNNRDGEDCDLVSVDSRKWDSSIPIYGWTYADEEGNNMDDWILNSFIPACEDFRQRLSEVDICYFEDEDGWYIGFSDKQQEAIDLANYETEIAEKIANLQYQSLRKSLPIIEAALSKILPTSGAEKAHFSINDCEEWCEVIVYAASGHKWQLEGNTDGTPLSEAQIQVFIQLISQNYWVINWQKEKEKAELKKAGKPIPKSLR